MASSVNVGTLESALKITDSFSAVFEKFRADAKAMGDRLTKLEASFEKTNKEVKKNKEGVEKITTEYKKVSASLDPVVARTQKYEKQVEVLNKALKAGVITQNQHTAALRKAESQIQQNVHWTDRLGKSIGGELLSNFTRFFAVTALISGAIAGIVSVTKQLVQANIEAEASEKRVEEAVRRYGASSGVTAEQINNLAQSMSRLTGLDDEAIADAEVIGLKYNRIGTEIFPRFTKAAIDLSVATGQDLAAAFEKAGKLVNQPLKALTLLSREGYAVSDSQAKLIKSFVAAGNIQEAQIEILKILEAQYGGAAAAARDTMGGALTALGTAWENMLEKFGEGHLSPIRSAIESLIKLIDSLGDSFSRIELGWLEFGKSVIGVLSSIYEAEVRVRNAFGMQSEDLARTVKELNSDIKEAEKNIALLRWKRGEQIPQKELESLGLFVEVHKRASSAAKEQTEAEARLGDAIERAGDVTRKAAEDVARSILALETKTENLRSLYAAATKGVREYNQEVLKQKVVEAILREEAKLRATNQVLTEKQRDTIEKNVIEQEELNKKLQDTLTINKTLIKTALTATENIVTKGFAADFKKMTDEAHRGMQVIQADVDGMLKGLAKVKDLDLEIEIESRLSDVAPHLREMELQYLSFMEGIGSGFERAGENAIEAGERILQTLAERFGITIDEIREKLQQLNDAPKIEALQLSGRSTLQVYKDEKAEINRIIAAGAKEGKNLTEDGQKAIYDLQSEFWDKSLASWSSALNYLADEFGGLFTYLAQAIQVIQQAKGMKDNLTDIGGQMGMSSGAAGAMGTFGAYLVIAKAMYDEFKRHAESRQVRRYDYAGILTREMNIGAGLEGQAKEASRRIKDAAEAFAEAIGGTIKMFSDLEIQVRKDGKYFRTYVEGELVGQFETMEEALQVGLRDAFLNARTVLTGISDLVREGLASIASANVPMDLPEMEDFLVSLREISELSWSDMARGMSGSIKHFDDLWKALHKIGEVTPAVTQGFADIIASEIRGWEDWYNSLTGQERSRQELLEERKREAILFESQKKLRIAEYNLRILDLQATAKTLKTKADLVNFGAKLGQSEIEIGGRLIQGRATLIETDAKLTEAFLKLIDAEIKAIQDIIQQLESIPVIDPEKIKLPKTGKGGGSSVKDWIQDKQFELDSRGLSEYARQQAEIIRQYEEQIAQTKRDSAERAKLIALKERELALLAQEQAKTTVANFREFLGLVTPFEQVRNTAAELIKQINESVFGDARKAAMIGRVLADVERQIEKLSMESAVSLLGSMLQDLEKFGASEALMAEARGHMAVMEHVLKMEHYRVEIEAIKLQGKLSLEAMAVLEKGLAYLEGISLDDIFAGITGGEAGQDEGSAHAEAWYAAQAAQADAMREAANEVDRLREAFRKAKDDILDTVREFDLGKFGVVTPEQSLEEAQNQFNAIVQNARRGNLAAFEDAPEAFEDLIEAMEKYSPALLATQGRSLRDELESLAGLDTIIQDNLIITDFEKRQQHRELVGSLNSGFADLSQHASGQENALQGIVIQLETNNETQARILQRLEILESNRSSVNGA